MSYYYPKITDITYEVSSDNVFPLQVAWNLEGKLTPSELARAEVRYYNYSVWEKIDSTLDGLVITFQANAPGVYAIFINEFAYSRFTEYMASLLPSWMKWRKDTSSVGQQFLNHFGLELEVIEGYLEWCLNNQFIGTASLEQIDVAYKAELPAGITRNFSCQITAGGRQITIVNNVLDFYRANGHVAFIDFEKRFIYTRHFYEDGINIKATDGVSTVERKNIPLALHHVWNSFDEFAFLLGLTRYPGERNAEFKERILDVFRYPPNATRLGLYHAIARELGLVRRVIWENDSEELIIRDVNIVPETILVDGSPVFWRIEN